MMESLLGFIDNTIRPFEFDYDTRVAALGFLKTERYSQRVRVLEAFLSCRVDGATDDEVAGLLSIMSSSVRARRHEIMRECPDVLRVVGKRKSSFGCLCDVWMSKDAAEAYEKRKKGDAL